MTRLCTLSRLATSHRLARLVARLLSVAMLFAFAIGPVNPKARQEQETPAGVAKCLSLLGNRYSVNKRITPFFLKGDFYGDGKEGYAVLVELEHKKGLAICGSGSARQTVLGAGTVFHEWQDLDFTAWEVHPRAVKVWPGAEGGRPPKLLGDAFLLTWGESGGGLVYWNGKRFAWYQQGD